MPLDATHDPALTSWVPSANDPGTDFPIQNLPFGVFRPLGADPREGGRIGVAIGDQVVDLQGCVALGLLDHLGPDVRAACESAHLNRLMALGRPAASALRAELSAILATDSFAVRRIPHLGDAVLLRQAEVQLLLPAEVGDYTDFYASVHHATNVGRMLRPDNPLLPNYKYVPIGYHGRASSIVPSGTPIHRPAGQLKPADAAVPTFGPSRSLDYECEVAAYVGPGNRLGEPVPLAEAERHLFGLGLLNDWSARDVQGWEYQPLGPFLAKNFASTVSPWVVTLDALEPFRAPLAPRAEGDPAPLPYLSDAGDAARGGVALTLEVWLRTARMRAAGEPAVRVSRASFLEMYWSMGQMLAHHTSNGCNLRPGDLLGSGTVSGPERDQRGCLLELTWRGKEPLELPGGERRAFLEDGDEVILRGSCEREGARRIGFGECRGVVTG